MDDTLSSSTILTDSFTETSARILSSTIEATSTSTTSSPCSKPTIQIQSSFTQKNPLKVYRSNMFSIQTESFFACNQAYSVAYEWSLNYVDLNKSIDLTNNPTFQSSELVIQPLSLNYGMYFILVQVNFSLSLNSFSLNDWTYVEIIPTGLIVNSMQNSASYILIGSQQMLTLDPATFTIDLDYLVSSSSLSFRFFCDKINISSTNVNQNTTFDLFSFKINKSQPDAFATCFNSNGKLKT